MVPANARELLREPQISWRWRPRLRLFGSLQICAHRPNLSELGGIYGTFLNVYGKLLKKKRAVFLGPTNPETPGPPYSSKVVITQRAQYPLIKQYTLNYKGLHIVI